MELMAKQGFKQTEVGLIPEDWEIVKFNEIGDAIIGLTYSPKDVNSSGKLVHRSSNIQDNKLAYYDNVYVTCDVPEKLILKKNDILICVRNGSRNLIGKSAIIDGKSIGETFGAFMSVFRPNGYAPLIYQCFISDIVQSQINASLGATINQITNKTLNSFLTPLPPTLTEQKAIATALSDVDALITSLEQTITKKKAIKQGAMQQLLTPNDSWKKTCLVELAENKKSQFDDGDWVESEYIISQGVRLIQTGNIGIGQFKDKGNKKYISEDSFNKLNCKEVLEGDLLVCRLAEPAGRACIMPNIGEYKVITSVDVSIFRGNPEVVNRVFLSQLFTTNSWFQKVIEKVGGTTHKRISRGALGKIDIEIPLIEEQQAIAQILSDMDAEINQLETKKEKYQAIKQGMMQELLTGKTRLI
jgi:type I restriction enzyme, S subunit